VCSGSILKWQHFFGWTDIKLSKRQQHLVRLARARAAAVNSEEESKTTASSRPLRISSCATSMPSRDNAKKSNKNIIPHCRSGTALASKTRPRVLDGKPAKGNALQEKKSGRDKHNIKASASVTCHAHTSQQKEEEGAAARGWEELSGGALDNFELTPLEPFLGLSLTPTTATCFDTAPAP